MQFVETRFALRQAGCSGRQGIEWQLQDEKLFLHKSEGVGSDFRSLFPSLFWVLMK